MRILGVDYGDVRTGLAICDAGEILACGTETIKPGGMNNTAVAVAAAARQRDAGMIVVGLPKNMDGSEGWRAEKVRAFAELLRACCPLPVEFWDERLSTAEAHRILSETDTRGKKRKAAVDTLSAQIILQNFIDARRNLKK